MGERDRGTPSVHEVVARARDEVGYREDEGNLTKYARDLDAAFGPVHLSSGGTTPREGQPWCAVFQSWLYWRSCGSMHPMPTGGFFTPGDLASWRTAGKVVDEPQPGDLAYYLRDGTPYHVGLVIEVNGRRFSTVEGNTTTSADVEANGIGVFQFGPFEGSAGDTAARSLEKPTAFARPDYDPAARRNDEEDDMALAWQDARFRNLFWSQTGMPLSPADVPNATVVVEPAHDQKLAAMCHAAWGVEGTTPEDIIRRAQQQGFLLPARGRG